MALLAENDCGTKTRELQNLLMDSTRWNDFAFRDDDIVIATYAKSGTTWVQQIVSQLIFDWAEGLNIHELSPWVDMRLTTAEVLTALPDQSHRRFLKTHLPADALRMSAQAKYIYIARDGRDTAWSFFNHHFKGTDEYFDRFNNFPGRTAPKLERGTGDVHEFYRQWLERDGFPYWSFWDHVRTWWDIRNQPNVKLIHFNGLKADLAGSVRQIAGFLGLAPKKATFETIVSHCSFDYMKANASLTAPRGGVAWKGGGATFINKGTNGRWRDVLSADEVAAYEARAVAELGPECAAWLAGEA